MIKIWDDHNKQWLQPMSITFDKNGEVLEVTAMIPQMTPFLSWYTIKGKDLDKIAITGSIEHNIKLIEQ